MAHTRRPKPPKRDRIDLLSVPTDITRATSAPPALSSTPSKAFKTLLASAKVSQAKTTFLTLPPEIRNVIYTYALYHLDNGIISSPTSPDPPSFSLSVTSRIQTQNSARNGSLVSQTLLAPTEVEDDEDDDDLSRPHEQCTHECLLQPAITRVSRLLRTEALPVFYNVNTFEFDAAKYKNVSLSQPSEAVVARHRRHELEGHQVLPPRRSLGRRQRRDLDEVPLHVHRVERQQDRPCARQRLG